MAARDPCEVYIGGRTRMLSSHELTQIWVFWWAYLFFVVCMLAPEIDKCPMPLWRLLVGKLQSNLLMHWIWRMYQSPSAVVTNNPHILVANKNTPLFIVHGSAGWLGFARLRWPWAQDLGPIQVCLSTGPGLKNNGCLRCAWWMTEIQKLLVKVCCTH